MPKTVALIDVDRTLILKTEANGEVARVLNNNIIDSLVENHITDVYLFADTIPTIEEGKWLIEQLQERGLTVWNVLAIPDLFWSSAPEELRFFESHTRAFDINISRDGTVTEDKLQQLKERLPTVGTALQRKQINAYPLLGKTFFDFETSPVTPRLRETDKIDGAKRAASILSTLLPGKPTPKALLYKHFVEHKPADCTRCVIFEDNAEDIKSIWAISRESDLNTQVIPVEGYQFTTEFRSYKGYHNAIQELLQRPSQIQEQTEIVSMGEIRAAIRENIENRSDPQSKFNQLPWPNIKDPASQNLDKTYYAQRGFRYFGSSDDSKELINSLKSKSVTASAKQFFIEKYLRDEKNKGKRLYTILVEQRHAHAKAQPNYPQNPIWLTTDMLYLIEEKYKKWL